MAAHNHSIYNMPKLQPSVAAVAAFNSSGDGDNGHDPRPPVAQFSEHDDDTKFFASFPPGYRFCPTDEELIVHYLYKKVHDVPLPRNQIHEVNIYSNTPDDITGWYRSCCENQWYFFTSRDKKYPKGDRPDRAAGNGYWKATGSDKKICHQEKVIGYKKSLVYYEGKQPNGKKTNWLMHEFKLHPEYAKHGNNRRSPENMRLDDFILCKLYRKITKSLKSKGYYMREEEPQDDGCHEEEQRQGEPSFLGSENGNQLRNFSPFSQNELNSSYQQYPSQNNFYYPSSSLPVFHQLPHSLPSFDSQIPISQPYPNVIDSTSMFDLQSTILPTNTTMFDPQLDDYFIDGEFEDKTLLTSSNLRF